MIIRSVLFSLFVALVLTACGSGASEPTTAPTLTPFPTRQALPTRTPFTNNAVATVTPIFDNPSNQGPIIPPTAIVIEVSVTPLPSTNNNSSSGNILNNGRGLTNSATMNNGEFQVEGYCTILNPRYGVAEDGNEWYCTLDGQRALTLRQVQFNDMCQRTYNNPRAIAIQLDTGQAPAYRWRCYELRIPPTPTSSAPPQLLNNGIGITTGATMNNGEFEVEGYCRAINPNYGVEVDENFWYCTNNDQRVLTLGVAEFDEICVRTYRNPGAYAEQINNNDRPAYRWRCFAIPR
ncbi:MAG: hypothetical protein ACFE0Q_10745 [Anaerolineae bacterium]